MLRLELPSSELEVDTLKMSTDVDVPQLSWIGLEDDGVVANLKLRDKLQYPQKQRHLRLLVDTTQQPGSKDRPGVERGRGHLRSFLLILAWKLLNEIDRPEVFGAKQGVHDHKLVDKSMENSPRLPGTSRTTKR